MSYTPGTLHQLLRTVLTLTKSGLWEAQTLSSVVLDWARLCDMLTAATERPGHLSWREQPRL